ncbi:restriction endonuclease subunit S [Aliarcobacter cryaerophilus]|uniref:restriction endonuclease subunit S n=1 Tax=Aliarcobacter cryaerophilus TaxID=28198 RepID=UPI0011DFDC97|nr:restriction endonuclease subunit S [Aliarcobacter cryaerophilus]
MNDNNIRFEAEFYNSKTGLNDNFFYGEDIIDFVQYGTSNELNEDNLGYPILRLNEFDSNFIGIPSKYCNSITQDIFENLRLLKNDVLICRTNGNPKYVGKSAIVMEDTQFAYASYLFKIRPKKEKINSSTLTIFLNSKYGRQEIEKYSMVSNQANFSPAKFKEIKIPIFSNTFQLEIETFVKTSYQKLQDSKNLYKEAESLLLKELDLVDFTPKDENIAIKSFKDSFMQTGRLDSEYYQTKYDEIEKIISEQGSFTCIKNEFNHIKISFDKSKNGYNYIEIGNVNVSDGTNVFNYVETQDLPANAKINVKNGDLLVSTVRPYRGAVTIIDTSENDLIVSGAFTVLRKKENSKINTQVLQVLLRTNIYKELLLKYNVGTSYPVIKDDDVLNLIIPIIDISIQNKIEEKIKKSFLLKEESKRLLYLAKKAVEIAIEKNENEAVEFINAQI